MADPNPTILFLCTGNYFRSRFAEMLFNHLAAEARLNWRAESRGLDTSMNQLLPGVISPATVVALRARGVAEVAAHREPIACSSGDLLAARKIVAVKEAEHRPLLARLFPEWVDRVEYWHIHDVDRAAAAVSLAEIEARIIGLIAKLTEPPRPV